MFWNENVVFRAWLLLCRARFARILSIPPAEGMGGDREREQRNKGNVSEKPRPPKRRPGGERGGLS
eukprot:69810-Pyramimonas_sp.AAC.1